MNSYPYRAIWIVSVFLFIGVSLLAPRDGAAIPAFARRTKLPCTTCHVGATDRLTRFGRDFLIRGHRTAEEVGLKELEEIHLGSYVSLSSENTFNSDTKENPSQSIESDLAIIAGGPIYDDFSFFIHSGLGSGGEVEEAYLSYNSRPAGDAFWFARAGRIMPSFAHVAGAGLSFGIEDPLVWADDSGPVPISTIASGLSVGFRSKGNAIGEIGYMDGGVAPMSDTPTNSKNVFASILKEFDEEGSYVGVQGFAGDQPLGDPAETTDHFWRLAVVGNLQREPYTLDGAVLFGSDNLPGGGRRNPMGFYAEAAWNAGRTVTPYARFEQIDSDGFGRTSLGTLGVSFRLSSVGILAVEGSHVDSPDGKTDRLGLLLHFVF